jgi:hypothetical protein
MAVSLTLLVAAVSGFAIWQGDVQAAMVAAPAVSDAATVAPVPPPAVPRRAAAAWWQAFAEQLLQHELTLDVHRGGESLSLRLTWRKRQPAGIAGSR